MLLPNFKANDKVDGSTFSRKLDSRVSHNKGANEA